MSAGGRTLDCGSLEVPTAADDLAGLDFLIREGSLGSVVDGIGVVVLMAATLAKLI